MDFTKICRLCCTEKANMSSILEYNEELSLLDIFSNILQIEVFSDDQLPQHVCEQCIAALANINKTIEVFRENDLQLRQQIFGKISVKKEDQDAHVELVVEPIIPKLEQFVEFNLDPDESSAMIDESVEEDKNIFTDDGSVEDYKPPSSEEQDSSQDEPQEPIPVKRKRKPAQKRKPRGEPKLPRETGKPGRRRRAKQENVPRLKDYICYICNSEPHESQAALFAHLHAEHSDDVPHTCTICTTETVVIDVITTLNVHKKMHAMPCKCPHCDRRYSNMYTVAEHVKAAHASSDGPGECPQCGKVCPTQATLQAHIYRHTIRIACDICGKTYSSKTKLGTHIERKHTQSTKKVECHICHKQLQSLDSFQHHLKYQHTTAEPLKCPQCPRTYTSKYSLTHHMKKHAANPDRRETQNWKNFWTVAEGEEGVRNGIRLKKCNLCGSIVRNISMHLTKTHFPREFPCTICDLVFKENKPLQVHLLEHSQGKFLICPICDREFKDRKALLTHLRTKKHRDHPMAKSLDWLEEKYPISMPMRMQATEQLQP